ncbi:MAG: hypothetical protein H2055_04795 [Sphingopyxis sp.]|nr:hypothetical protein [Sphingopyxis sp.]
MTHAPAPPVVPSRLANAANLLARALDSLSASNTARIEDLTDAIREAETYLHRRAAYNARDRACYRTGSALEPNRGHLLDDIALAGFDHLGAFGLLLLVDIARHHPHESLSGLLRILFDSEAGACIRAWGSWSRLTWLRQLYINETATFLRSKKGRDPMQSWRHDKVTVNQKHLVREIARALGIAEPKFRKRGSAFEWLKEQGGNPRFWTPPTMPALPALPEHLA